MKWVQEPDLAASRASNPAVDGSLIVGPREEGMISPATDSTMVQAMTAGASELSVNGGDTSEKAAGGNGGGLLGPVEGDKPPAVANTSKEGNILTPRSNSWRGKHSEQTVYDGFRSLVERNVCIGSPVPVDSDIYHTEQHGLDVDREAVCLRNT